jgi:2-polyprenyl-3-methyl-5-hydroxy-6-metoxy-1,4-benzoquinol methylase
VIAKHPEGSAKRRTSGAVTRDAEGTVTGNTYDKYGSSNPVVKRMMAGFEAALADLFAQADPQSLLDVGCGEGVLTHQWAAEIAPRRVVGIDLEDETLRAAWAERTAPNLEYRVIRPHPPENLPFGDDEFDVAAAIEVLEHVPDPEHTVAEMARVASRWLLVSVPREPVWRVMNLARGAYVRDLGNTPGHLNHWSKRSFARLLSQHGDVVEARTPFPWTMLLVRL